MVVHLRVGAVLKAPEQSRDQRDEGKLHHAQLLAPRTEEEHLQAGQSWFLDALDSDGQMNLWLQQQALEQHEDLVPEVVDEGP